MKKKKLFLLDVFPILYRSHFAMQNQHLYTTTGLNTSAILGFCNYIFQIIFNEKPSYIAAAFDNYSFERTTIHSAYKANRDKMPIDISIARKYVIEIIEALNIKILQIEGYEADDVIGTVAKKAAMHGDLDVFIVSPDKDFAQLVGENIFLYRPSYQGLNFDILDADKVKSKYGVPPTQIADLLALKGDPVDNIPGVPKIGEKTSIELLLKYKDVEEVLDKRDEIRKASIRQTLIENEESARISKALALINTELPIDYKDNEFQLLGPKVEKLVKLLDELEFIRLKERIFSNTFYKKFFTDSNTRLTSEATQDTCIVNEIYNTELESLLDKVEKTKVLYFLSSHDKEFLNLYFFINNQVYTFSSNINKIPPKLINLLTSNQILKITYNSKPISKILMMNQYDLNQNMYDVLLKHYILSPNANHKLDKIIAQEFGLSINTNNSTNKLCLEVQQLIKLKEKWDSDSIDLAQEYLYKEIDLPVLQVIGRMELNGIKIDTEALKGITVLFQEEIERVEQLIFNIAGDRINLKSSKQTAEMFSRILKDTPFKRTKTGQLSTSEASLLDYAGEHEVAEHLLRYRRLSKIVSTYTESLPTYINSQTGRIHADFLQTSTATGRLSCNNPNLQNLPIQSEEGKEVRRAVIPENDDYEILAADYSQIELRLLACLSKDQGLSEAFLNHEDIHTTTAAKVFNVTDKEVTHEMRSKAKMVNYGIAYGISAFGLSQRLKISVSEGKQIIEQYFLKFPGIKRFIDETIQFVRDHGYTKTLTGRRRYIEDINSKNGTERRAAERIAINAPIQGLAADIIKISMIEIDNEFRNKNLKTKMIMQVHDELVFEVLKNEMDEVKRIVKEKMEHALKMDVPLEVNIAVGNNWLEMEDVVF
jgi:DNA polymerase-1